MASYNNGLYTPWAETTAATTRAAAVTSSTMAPRPTTSSSDPWAAYRTTTTTDPWESYRSSAESTTTDPWDSYRSSASSSSSSSSSSSTTTPAPSSSTISFAQLGTLSSTFSTPTLSSSSSAANSLSDSAASATLVAGALLASNSATSTPAPAAKPFNIAYLTPIFIIVPLIIVAAIFGYSHGRCWGRRRLESGGAAYGGAGGSLGRRRRQVGFDDEEGGLVEGKRVEEDEGGWDEIDEKAAMGASPPATKWSALLPASLRRGPSNGSSSSSNGPPVPFVAVSYASLDQPFLPPTNSVANFRESFHALPQSNSAQARDEQGWGWGTKNRKPEPAPKVTSEAWGWSTTKYRAKSASSRKSGGSMRSRLSDRLFGDGPPSPSVYSPYVEAYGGLEGGEEDLEQEEPDLDAYLGESRVGDNTLAKRYMGGERHLAEPPTSSLSRSFSKTPTDQTRDRYFARHANAPPPLPSVPSFDQLAAAARNQQPGFRMEVELPAAPRRTMVSPTKASAGSALLRNGNMPSTPPPHNANLLFSYDTPPSQQCKSTRPSPERRAHAPSVAVRPPLPSPPKPRVPLGASIPQPHFYRPDSTVPLSPATQPGLFFAQSAQAPVVGSSMPPFQPGLRASESNFSIDGFQGLVFGEEDASGRPMGQSDSRMSMRDAVAKEQRPLVPRAQEPRLASSKSRSNNNPPQSSHPPAPPNATVPALTLPRKKTSSRQLAQSTSSEPFNPIFSDPAPLEPLQHPSRVRNAVHNLEVKAKVAAASVSPPPSPNSSRRHPTPTRTSSAEDDDDLTTAENSSGDAHVGALLLNRSRTSANLTGVNLSGGGDARRPLSSDPARLGAMLRRPSSGAGGVLPSAAEVARTSGTAAAGGGGSVWTTRGGDVEALSRRTGESTRY